MSLFVKFFLLFVILGAFFAENKALAADLYVATSGNDANSCLTSGNPCATIQGAINKSANDDVISVAAGTYTEDIVVDKRLSFRGANAGVALGVSPGTRTSETVIIGEGDLAASGITFDGFTFKRPALARDAIAKLLNAATIENTRIINSAFDLGLAPGYSETACGSALSGGSTWTVRDSLFQNQVFSDGGACLPDRSQSQMIYLVGSGSLDITGSLFLDVERSVYLKDIASGIVSGNRFTGARTQGVYAGTDNLVVRGNTFAGFGGILLDDAIGVVIENNLFSESNQIALFASNTFQANIKNNAFLGELREAFLGVPLGATIVNDSATSPLLLGSNYWNSFAYASIFSKVASSGGMFSFVDLWIESYVDDTSKAGALGYWPKTKSYAWQVGAAGGLQRDFSGYFTNQALDVTLLDAFPGKMVIEAYDASNPLSSPYPYALGDLYLGSPASYYGISSAGFSKAQVCMDIPADAFPSFIAPDIYALGDTWVKGNELSRTSDTLCAEVAGAKALALAHPAILPENTKAPTMSGTSRIKETLKALDGTWQSFPDSISRYLYQWQRSRQAAGPWDNISGETDSQYRLSDRDVGGYIRVRVRAENSKGGRNAFSEGSLVQKSRKALQIRRSKKTVFLSPTRKVLFAKLSCLEGYCDITRKKAFVTVGKRKYQVRISSRRGQLIPGERRNIYLDFAKLYPSITKNKVVLQITAQSSNGDRLRGKVSGMVRK